MNAHLDQNGYDRKLIKNRSNIHKSKIVIRLFLFLIFIGFIAGFLVDYLARWPRERHARNFTYWQKVKYGTHQAWRSVVLTEEAPRADLKNSKLPVFEIFIKGKRLDNLEEHLPESGEDYKSAKVKLINKAYKAKVKFRGDSINHWALPAKSWRVHLKKGKDFESMTTFNLNVPRIDTQLSNWLGYQIAEKFNGILVPYTDIVHFRLNRRFNGIRLLLEQPDQNFLIQRGLAPGKIFVGDIDTDQIYGNVKRKHLYSDVSAWKVDHPSPNIDGVTADEIATLINIIKTEVTPYSFYYKMSDIVDVDSLLNYMAMLELVGSVHVDETHNGKFYFNPESGKFVPIAWDTVAYMWQNKHKLDMGSNALFRTVLYNPEFREKKDKILWDLIHSELTTDSLTEMITDQAKKMKKDVFSFPLKLHANDKGIRHISNQEWIDSLSTLIKSAKNRNSFITKELETAYGKYVIEKIDNKQLLGIQATSRAGLIVKKVVLKLDSTKPVKALIRRRGIEDISYPIQKEMSEFAVTSQNGKLEFVLDDHLFSKRRFKKKKFGTIVPATYVYEIALPAGVNIKRVSKISATNAITGKKASIYVAPDLTIIPEHRTNIVWWEPKKYIEPKRQVLSGDVNLTSTLTIDKYSELVIQPGSHIQLAKDVSIVVNGGVLTAIGTPKHPITFSRLEKNIPWGVVAVNNQGKLNFDHVNISGTSETHNAFVYYPGSINIYNSSGSVTNTGLSEGYLSLKSSQVTLENIKVQNILPYPIYALRSSVKQKKIQHVKVTPMHSQELLTMTAYGTPPRKEREFKYSFSFEGKKVDIKKLAEGIQKALKKSIKKGEVWNAPQITQTNYRVDKKAKEFVYRDVYFDTEDNLAYKHDVSYRLRNRFSDYSDYKLHLKYPLAPDYWPYRAEFQAKFDRKSLGSGFSVINEARFEFRKESSPFSAEKLPPPSPWSLSEFIPYFQTGMYKGIATYSGKELVQFLNSKTNTKDRNYSFLPKLVLLNIRYRQHLNLKTPWGSGPNPEQAYIITIDQSDVYSVDEYLTYLSKKELGVKKLDPPDKVGVIVEMEVEFERNVSDVLDQQILLAREQNKQSELDKLEKAKEAFLHDQQTIMTVITDYFAKKKVKVIPALKSKYAQSFDIIN